jgi:hypothetical protein
VQLRQVAEHWRRHVLDSRSVMIPM